MGNSPHEVPTGDIKGTKDKLASLYAAAVAGVRAACVCAHTYVHIILVTYTQTNTYRATREPPLTIRRFLICNKTGLSCAKKSPNPRCVSTKFSL